jgi:hypothetical protein
VARLDLLRAAHAPLLDLADGIDEDTGWRPTRLPGWTVRDLLFHLASDSQRALVALSTPADGPADTDEVSYWSGWQPGTPGARDGLRGTRIMASAWSSVRGPAELYAETARAVLVVAGRAAPDAVVLTQGHRLTGDSLLRRLAVEAAVHQLDLDPVVGPPGDDVLDEVGRVLDALLGGPRPNGLDPVRWARVGTGREPLTEPERQTLGDLAARLPLFG